ncbi:hypothetical protein B0H11DRAFT_1754339 [Mycena galericulata]|nr:hypothetical protein B0H11DRAFT_1754339 [Mycena galericulata]
MNVWLIFYLAVSTLLRRYKIDPPTIGRFDFVTDKSLRGVSSTSLALRVGQLFIPHLEIVESCNSAIAALLNTINWIECRGWDGRNSILCAIEKTESRIGAVAVLVGANAPIVIEPDQGRFIGNIECLPTDAEYANFYLTALDDTYSAYRSTVLSCSKNHNPNGTANGRVNGSTNDNPNGATMGTKGSSWDPDGKMLLNDYLSRPEAKEFQHIPTFMRSLTPDAAFLSRFVVDIFLRASAEDHHTRVAPAAMDSDMTTTYPFLGLMALLERVPGYELFEKRIATFICNPQGTNYFCVLRVKGDTDMLRTDMLSKQLDK